MDILDSGLVLVLGFLGALVLDYDKPALSNPCNNWLAKMDFQSLSSGGLCELRFLLMTPIALS